MPSTQTELLKDLSADQAAALMALGQSVTVPAGGVLFELGDSAERVYHVIHGRVALTLPMQVRGQSQDILIEERLPGDTLGWSGLIPPHRFTLKASASDESEMLAFSRETLLAHFAEHPSIAFTVTRNIATVIGHRLRVFQAMWTREMQRVIDLRYA